MNNSINEPKNQNKIISLTATHFCYSSNADIIEKLHFTR